MGSENPTMRPVDAIIEHDHYADDISNAEPMSSAAVNAKKTRYKRFLKILHKVNMVFLAICVCYFTWTISVSSRGEQTNWNRTRHGNATLQDDNSSRSGNRRLPFLSSARDNQPDPAFRPNIVLPVRRTKKRRKKMRNRKRNRWMRNKPRSYSSIEEYLNLTSKPSKNKHKRVCNKCKIRKRKGRNRYGSRKGNSKLSIGKKKTSLMRQILEKVADDTVPGVPSVHNGVGEPGGEWRRTDITGGRTRGADNDWKNMAEEHSSTDSFYNNGKTYIKADEPFWSPWSPCSTTCGTGTQKRMRKCGSACKELETRACVKPVCQDTTADDSGTTITQFYQWEDKGFVPPVHLPQPEFINSEVDACGEWVKCNKQFAQDFINNSSLPGCPCSYPLKRVKSRAIHDVHLNRSVQWVDASRHSDLVYKPGAHSCIRSQLSPGTLTLAIQQCCYDGTLALVTRGKSAGTPNLISPAISKELHYKVDLLPWIICKGDWSRYNQVLPPNNRLACRTRPDEETIAKQMDEVTNY